MGRDLFFGENFLGVGGFRLWPLLVLIGVILPGVVAGVLSDRGRKTDAGSVGLTLEIVGGGVDGAEKGSNGGHKMSFFLLIRRV